MLLKTFFKSSFLFLILFLASCSNLREDVSPSTTIQEDVVAAADGWRVSWYWDKDKDETSDFSSYRFFFRENGKFEAVREGATVTGSWQVSSSSRKMIIRIGNAKPLSDLDDDWLIVESSDNLIKLKDDNDEHLEELHFSRR